MSILHEINDFLLLEHKRDVEIYQENEVMCKLKLSEKLFMNFKRKSKNKKLTDEHNELEKKVIDFLNECKKLNLFRHSFKHDEIEEHKQANIKLMNEFYEISSTEKEFHGENNLDHGIVMTFTDGIRYVIPKLCKFYNKNINDISNFLPSSNKFDFIVIDPPWQNRYIKRLKKTNRKQSYYTMPDDDIMKIPIENYTHKNSIVVIWCTNSQNHLDAIEEKFLAKWKLKIIGKWKWIKLDKCGELFCSFDGNKKPYESIIVCSHVENENPCDLKNLVIFSISSSIHSHKPPLTGIILLFRKYYKLSFVTNAFVTELFHHVLPPQPKCLEIFARSLYTNFTSIGMEVLKLQNALLFDEITIEPPTCP
jgi:N(6)-adenine-specific DNA methyltransferase